MKRKLLFILLIVFIVKGYAQDTIVNYYDVRNNLTTKEFASTLQYIVEKDSLWKENIYYLKNKRIKSIGQYLDKKLTIKIGEFQTYNIKGEINSIINYNIDGQYHGKYLTFKNDKKKTVGNYKNGKKFGLWNFYQNNGNKIARIIYKEDKVYKFDLWNEKGEKINEPLIFERRAKFTGGIKKFYKKIKRELAPKLKRLKIPFKLYVRFTIDKDGDVKNVEMRNPPSIKHRKIIEDFFYRLPRWKPAIQLNRPVSTNFTVPLKLGK